MFSKISDFFFENFPKFFLSEFFFSRKFFPAFSPNGSSDYSNLMRLPQILEFLEKKNSKFRKCIRLLLELEPLGENAGKNFREKKIGKKNFGKFSKKEKKSEIFEKNF